MKKSFLVLTAISFFLITSCQNFLNSSNLKKEIDDKIRIAKAPSTIIDIAAETGTGIVTPNEPVEKKEGEQIYLRFSESSSYEFIMWQCIDTTTGLPVDDYIDFGSEKNPVTTATVTKLSPTLKIVPFCLKRPIITGHGPSGSVCANNTIYITFEDPVDIMSFRYIHTGQLPAFTLSNYITIDEFGISSYRDPNTDETVFKNIEIRNSAGVLINDNFNPPVLEMDNKRLVITAKPYTFDFWTDSLIQVKLNKDIYAQNNIDNIWEYAHLLSDYTFEYTATSELDHTAPDIVSLTVNSSDNKKLYLFNEPIDEEFYSDENIVSSILINAKAYDLNTGISKLEVTETLLYDPYGKTVGKTSTTSITDGYTIDSSNNYNWNDYQYNFSTEEDGIIKLNFTAVDGAGNRHTDFYDYIVIKDTKVDLDYIRVYNIQNSYNGTSPSSNFGIASCTNNFIDKTLTLEENINKINANLKNIYVTLLEPVYTAPAPKGTVYKRQEDYESIVLYSGTDENNLSTFEMTYEGQETASFIDNNTETLTEIPATLRYKTTINELYEETDTILKIVVTDKNGNTNSILQAIPRLAKLPYYTEYKTFEDRLDFTNKGFDFLYNEYEPSAEYKNLTHQNRLSFYSYEDTLCVNTNPIITVTNGFDFLFDAKNSQTSSSRIQLINLIDNFENLTFNYYPLPFYVYKNKDAIIYSGSMNSYYFLAGPISLDNTYMCNVNQDTISNPDFKDCEYEVRADDDDHCFYVNVTIPEESENLVYSYSITPYWYQNLNKVFEYTTSYSESKVFKYSNSTIQNYSDINHFELTFYVTEKSTGNKAASSSHTVDLSFKTTNKDFTPPTLLTTNELYISPDTQFLINDGFTSYYSELENAEYWYVNYDFKWKDYQFNEQYKPTLDGNENPVFAPRTLNPVYLNKSDDAYIYSPNKYSLAGLKDGIYTLCASVTDSSGNKTTDSLHVFNLKTLPFSNMKVEYIADSIHNTKKISTTLQENPLKNPDTNNPYQFLTCWYYDNLNNKWKPVFSNYDSFSKREYDDIGELDSELDPDLNYRITGNNTDNKFKKEITIPKNLNSKWIRVNYLGQDSNQLFKYRMAPVYIYIGENNQIKQEDCKLKRFEEFSDISYIVHSDYPCIVETIQSPTDLSTTETNWELNGTYSAWDLCGETVASQSFDAGHNWYYLNPFQIEEGFYYVTRVIFADGTETIGKIRKRN